MNAKATGTTLYYPYIHPRKVNNLKAALLYWDRIRRIVPDSLTHGRQVMDDIDDCRLLADSGLLIATRPEEYEQSAAQRFFAHVEPQRTEFTLSPEIARHLANQNRGIHIEKIGYRVLEKLQEMDLAHRVGEWVAMHDQVGAFYMFCLASEMSRQMLAPLMTDSARDAKMGEALLFEADSERQVSKTLFQLGLSLPSAGRLRTVPMRQIVEFSERRSEERKAFRNAIEGILEVARTIRDPNALDDYLSSHGTAIRSAVTDLQKTIDELRVGAVTSAAKITVPAGASAALAALPISGTASAILGGLGLAIGAISCYAETRGKLRQARTGSPYHYLVSVARRFRQ